MELARTEQGRGALGHFPTRRYCRQRAQTSVPNVRLPFPYLSKPLSGGYSPSHRWIQMNSLYLEKVSSPTTNWATSRQTHMQETGGEWPTGQLTQRGTETTVKLPPPTSLVPHGGGYAQRVSGFPSPLRMVALSRWYFTSTWPVLLRTPELLSSRQNISLGKWSHQKLSPELDSR